MARAIFQVKGGAGRRAVAISLLGRQAGGRGTPQTEVHDGDTINVELNGDLGVRFLGIDTPEMSFILPGARTFTSISDPAWTQFLENPLAGRHHFRERLGEAILSSLEPRLTADTGPNHARHATMATTGLRGEIERDMAEQELDNESFRFFHSFASEIMDGFGRLLCYVNREQPNSPRPLSYNERLLKLGLASPYFIWPNVNPFRAASSKLEAVPNPKSVVEDVGHASSGLGRARQFVKEARRDKRGIFDGQDPLLLEAFELRFLARMSLPHRWVIDLTSNDGALLPPSEYPNAPLPEDRLFVPAEYVPLFESGGWRRG